MQIKILYILYIFCLKLQQTVHCQKIKDFWQLFDGSGFKGLTSALWDTFALSDLKGKEIKYYY